MAGARPQRRCGWRTGATGARICRIVKPRALSRNTARQPPGEAPSGALRVGWGSLAPSTLTLSTLGAPALPFFLPFFFLRCGAGGDEAKASWPAIGSTNGQSRKPTRGTPPGTSDASSMSTASCPALPTDTTGCSDASQARKKEKRAGGAGDVGVPSAASCL